LDVIAEMASRDKAMGTSAENKVKIGPWNKVHVYSQFTSGGTAQEDYKKVALEQNVAAALLAHKRDLIEEEAAMRAQSSRKSTRDGKGKRLKGTDSMRASSRIE
jgi:hypothetical protein